MVDPLVQSRPHGARDFKDKELLEFHWDANNEGMVWTEDGKPLQGLTGGGERIEWIIPDWFRDGKEHTIYIEMACNGMFGNAPGGDSIQPPNQNKYYQLSKADIVAVNKQARSSTSISGLLEMRPGSFLKTRGSSTKLSRSQRDHRHF